MGGCSAGLGGHAESLSSPLGKRFKICWNRAPRAGAVGEHTARLAGMGGAGESSIRIATSIGRKRRRKIAAEEGQAQGAEGGVQAENPNGCCACNIQVL